MRYRRTTRTTSRVEDDRRIQRKMHPKKLEKLKAGEIVTNKEPGNSMTPKIKHRQQVTIAPATWETVDNGDIVYCKVSGHYYTHLVVSRSLEKGCLIGNNHGHINGWTKQVFGKVIKVGR